jgi:hypothetical protein
MVITTAGFIFGPELKIERVIDFRRNVDATNEWMAKAHGCTFAPVLASMSLTATRNCPPD